MRRTPTLAALSCAAALALPATSHAAQRPAVDWNKFLLGIQATPGAQPATVQPTYDLAVMHAAIYDAVAASSHSGTPYLQRVAAPRGASSAAAADTAARDTLAALYPAERPAIDQQYAAELGHVPAGSAKTGGITVGRRAAAQMLRARANDGSTTAPPAFTPASQPGSYQLTPPALSQPVFTHWSRVKPFTLRAASQFRPSTPPAVTSPAYQAALTEVQKLGSAQNSTRTPDQTQIGLFWNPPIWAAWNHIAETTALARPHAGIAADARTFAALNLALADTAIAFYDAKYTYRVWRPITAIRMLHNASWTPLSATAPDPSYPGAHAAISYAAATVLTALDGDAHAFQVQSSALPGVMRSFTSYSGAAREATVSRIYNGNHTRLDEAAGERLGRRVGHWTLAHLQRG